MQEIVNGDDDDDAFADAGGAAGAALARPHLRPLPLRSLPPLYLAARAAGPP